MRVKTLAEPVDVEPPRSGEDAEDCVACNTPDDAYIWVSERWRVRGMDRPTGLPMVLILECRSHLDIGDLPNLLAAELGVMTVRLERAIRSLDGVARVHVNRWGDGSAHLHMWFLARPYGRLQLRGTFLSLWDDILPVIPEEQWLENLALVAEWLAGFGGRAIAEPAHIHWQSPSTFGNEPTNTADTTSTPDTWQPTAPTDSPSAGFTWNNATPEDQEPASDDSASPPSNSARPDFNGASPASAPPSHSAPASTELATAAVVDHAPVNPTSGSTVSEAASRSDLTAVNAETRDLSSYAIRTATNSGDSTRTTSTHADDPNADHTAASAPADERPPAADASVSGANPPPDNAHDGTVPRQPGEAPTLESPSASSPTSVGPADARSTDASGTGTAPTTASTPAPPTTGNPTRDQHNADDGAGQATQSEPSTAPTIPSQHNARTTDAAEHLARRTTTPQSATATDNPAPTQAAPSH
jgi:hypothetical protein